MTKKWGFAFWIWAIFVGVAELLDIRMGVSQLLVGVGMAVEYLVERLHDEVGR